MPTHCLPRFLSPEGASRWAEVMQVRDLFHAEPAEFGTANCAGHVIARTVIHLHNQDVAAWTNLERDKNG